MCQLEPSSSSKREFNTSTPTPTPTAFLVYSPPTQFIPKSSLSLPHNPFSNPSFSELHLSIQGPLQPALYPVVSVLSYLSAYLVRVPLRNLQPGHEDEYGLIPIASPSRQPPHVHGGCYLRLPPHLHLYQHQSPSGTGTGTPHLTRYRYLITGFPPCHASLPAAIPHHHQDTRSTERYYPYHQYSQS